MNKLEELKAAYEAATPGEWWYAAASETEYETGVGDIPLSVPTTRTNAQFIALSHNAMPMLLEAAQALKGMLEVFGDEFGMGDSEVCDAARAALERLK